MYDFQTNTARFWAYLAVIALLAGLGMFAVRRRRVPAAKPFAVGAFLLTASLICLLLEVAAVDPTTTFSWYRLYTLTFFFAVTATAAFCLEYAYPGRWLTRRNLLLAALPCVFVTFVIFTPSWRGLLWRSVTIGDWVEVDNTPVSAALLAYGWALLLINVGALGWLFTRSPEHRRPLALLIGGQIVGRLIFMLQYFGPTTGRSPDLVFLATSVPWSLYAVGLFGFRLFDPLPAAFATAVQQMREGMLVFDTEGVLLNANPAAGRILGQPISRRAGKTWRDIFPGLPPLRAWTGEALECALGPSGAQRRYALELTPLADQRRAQTGTLLLLHDVTEQRAAEARAAEQQWAQAVLQEREHLAQELHDGFSQDLAFLKMQAQAAQLYLASGQGDAARDSLARLAEVARGVQDDTRQLIGNLLLVSLAADGFHPALCELLRRFEGQTGLVASLAVDPKAEAACASQSLPADTAVQLLRIVQEALANIRKHAGAARQVTVSLTATGGQLHLTVADDGCGFDPARIDANEHFGLQVMERRAESIGGQLTVSSAPGRGACVSIVAPLNPPKSFVRTV